jgi:hypothetical protein
MVRAISGSLSGPKIRKAKSRMMAISKPLKPNKKTPYGKTL